MIAYDDHGVTVHHGDWDAATAAAACAAVARLLAGQPDAEMLGQMLGVGA